MVVLGLLNSAIDRWRFLERETKENRGSQLDINNELASRRGVYAEAGGRRRGVTDSHLDDRAWRVSGMEIESDWDSTNIDLVLN